jgi:hypothetical protein
MIKRNMAATAQVDREKAYLCLLPLSEKIIVIFNFKTQIREYLCNIEVNLKGDGYHAKAPDFHFVNTV